MRCCIRKIFFLAVIVMTFSCKSVQLKEKDYAYVMVYDHENNGVMDARIFVDEAEIGKTDVYGKFLFPIESGNGKNGGETKIVSVKKSGYEEGRIETKLVHGSLLYFRLSSHEHFAKEAEGLLDSGKLDEALLMIEKALEIEGGRKDYRLLKEIIELRIEG